MSDVKDVRITFDARSRPFLDIKLKERLQSPYGVGYEVDGVIVGVATLDMHGNIDRIRMYTSMSYYDLKVLRAALLEPLPLIQTRAVTEDNN
jgi:hypothetical protein